MDQRFLVICVVRERLMCFRDMARSGIIEIVCIHHDEEKLLTLRCDLEVMFRPFVELGRESAYTMLRNSC